MSRRQLPLFDRKLLGPALLESVTKLDPRVQWRNPVMFVVYIGTIVTALLYVQALAGHGEARPGSILLIGVLTYVPALALGPIVEHFMLPGGR